MNRGINQPNQFVDASTSPTIACPHGYGHSQQCRSCVFRDVNTHIQEQFYIHQLQASIAQVTQGYYSPISPTSPNYPQSPSTSSPSPTSSQGGSWMPAATTYTPEYQPQSQSYTQSFPVLRQVGSAAMTEHAMSHRQKEPMFFCEVPGCQSRGFTERHNLKYHMRSHRGERPYGCPLCGNSFRSKSDLTRHSNKSKKPCERKPY